MTRKIKKDFLPFEGIKLQINENKKSIENRRKRLFLSIINDLENALERSDRLNREFGVNVLMFEDLYYKVIENLIIEYWGEIVAEVIFWWVYDVVDPKKDNYYLFEKDTDQKIIVKTPTQLYNAIKKFKLFKKI